MEFLVRFETNLPDTMPAAERNRLKALERDRAQQLRSEGTLLRLWRVPGRQAVIGLWNTTDATHLHDALVSLPAFPWMDVTVEALATHPQEQR
ncbi:muconolactone Delta-isomerase family protein [Streptomyces sp. B3I8]|uniref:muconolactone Delta-isomerase family protein n=1 Tax=Streptomyces sp. B3I8 TaxID=3042303 RepID=UPI0027848E0F|nr:muconolactone Delta-isomerase family protein [Streptomyces sp. B3I8]MDQ0787101.1 muconolactone D-isomerase [Streptomyces sp. B3I8]